MLIDFEPLYLTSINDTDIKFVIGSEEIQGTLPVDVLVITVDDNLNFNLLIGQIFLKLKSLNQLKVLYISDGCCRGFDIYYFVIYLL